MEAEFIVKLGNGGRQLATIADHEKTAPIVLDFIRRGLHVDYRCGDEAPMRRRRCLRPARLRTSRFWPSCARRSRNAAGTAGAVVAAA